jgi:hypothetical protein
MNQRLVQFLWDMERRRETLEEGNLGDDSLLLRRLSAND